MRRSSTARQQCLRRFGAGTVPLSEVGGSIVAFLLVLPLLLTFLFAVVDLGRTVFLNMALEDAASAACRVACASGEETPSQEALRVEALAASPALGNGELSLKVQVSRGEPVNDAQVLRIFDEEAGTFVEYPAQRAHRSVRVELALEGVYLTPVGSLIAAASGRADSTFEYRATAAGETAGILEEGAI